MTSHPQWCCADVHRPAAQPCRRAISPLVADPGQDPPSCHMAPSPSHPTPSLGSWTGESAAIQSTGSLEVRRLTICVSTPPVQLPQLEMFTIRARRREHQGHRPWRRSPGWPVNFTLHYLQGDPQIFSTNSQSAAVEAQATTLVGSLSTVATIAIMLTALTTLAEVTVLRMLQATAFLMVWPLRASTTHHGAEPAMQPVPPAAGEASPHLRTMRVSKLRTLAG